MSLKGSKQFGLSLKTMRVFSEGWRLLMINRGFLSNRWVLPGLDSCPQDTQEAGALPEQTIPHMSTPTYAHTTPIYTPHPLSPRTHAFTASHISLTPQARAHTHTHTTHRPASREHVPAPSPCPPLTATYTPLSNVHHTHTHGQGAISSTPQHADTHCSQLLLASD